MLSLVDPRGRPGMPWQRREFLRAGGLALGGLTLPGLLQAKAEAQTGGWPLGDKSVVFLFLHGGPSQTETFDPKMTAPAEIRSVTGEVATRIPGVTFGGTFPRLAALADQMAVVRSFVPGDANHNIKPLVCPDTFQANLGSLYARIVGPNHPETGMPRNAALFPQAVDPSTGPEINSFGNFRSSGSLGAAYAPFVPGGGGEMQSDMKLAIPMSRLDDRKLLLARLDEARFARESSIGGIDRLREQAFSTLAGGVAGAFDLSEEDPRLVERYDTAPLVRPEQISRKWNNYSRYVDNAKSLGKLLLLARRLCERGAGFVTVTTNFVWDMHADSNNAGVAEGMDYMGRPLDYALSAFIEDVRERGLQDKILLVCCGEIGRTPRVNNRGGRDHWGALGPLLFSGGGLPMGQVIGQSTADAGAPLSEPIGVQNLIATIMHNMFDISQLRLQRNAPTEIVRAFTTWEPIAELS